MPNDLIAAPLALGPASGGREPLSSLYREIGLAAVASGLKLQLNTLDADVAEAVERGAAALFLAGYGPSLIRYPIKRQPSAQRTHASQGVENRKRLPPLTH
jgi:hypothetical protein